ncbi:MAG: class I adenylate-forming enzyme family protein [bacterium]
MTLLRNYDNVEMNWVGDWIGRRALLTPKREAVYDPGSERRFTYGELNERANRVGAYLLDSLKLQKRDVVCFISRNRVEPIDLYFACGKVGTILSPLSYRLAKPELDDLLQRIRPRALFYEAHFAELVNSLEPPESLKIKISFEDEESIYERQVLSAAHRDVNRPLAMNDIFLYVHTGGTTATPKICIITHRQMVWNSIDLIATGSGGMGLGGKELVTFPFFHIGGWNTVTPIFHMGGSVVLMREFNPDLALELIDREQITHFGGVEAMFQFMISSPRFKTTSFKSVHYINSAGAPCSAEVMQSFWDKGIPLTQSYGLTEAGPSNFIFLPEGHSMDEIKGHADSIGFPMFHCDAKIVDQTTGEPVKHGEVGELCFRSLHSFEGYLNDPERTNQVIDREGWIHSGDLAKTDEYGFVKIIGRADNMFVSGGENISPEEIEQALLKHPSVAQAGVAGVPDEKWGQVALAVVVLKPNKHASEDELKVFCRKQLAAFKVPKYVRFNKCLPLTGAGKVDRQALRKLFLGG